MPSPYVILGDRPLDQWKVVELKEELKKRKLTIRGLKEDLVKRLDEAVRLERESSVKVADDDVPQSDISPGQAEEETLVSQRANDFTDESVETVAAGMDSEDIVDFSSVETTMLASEFVEPAKTLSESCFGIDGSKNDVDFTAMPNFGNLSPLEGAQYCPSDDIKQFPETETNSDALASSVGLNLPGNDLLVELINSTSQTGIDDFSLLSGSSIQPLKYQVTEAEPDSEIQVISDSVSTEFISINGRTEIEIDEITEDIQLASDVKVGMVQCSPVTADPDDVEVPLDNKESEKPLENFEVVEPVQKTEVVDSQHGKEVLGPVSVEPSARMSDGRDLSSLGVAKSIGTGDLGSEKINLDRIPEDDSMEEDVLETKKLEEEPCSVNEVNSFEKSHLPTSVEDDHVDVVGGSNPIETKPIGDRKNTASQPAALKRKLHENVSTWYNEPVKKARNLKGSEPQNGDVLPAITTKGLPEPRPFSATESAANAEQIKERVVPPSLKVPTDSLRIDYFLRPFTLKAVQELLGRTGTVTSFWMDHIKTHCYVSYSTVEEAESTRNAVYNLQWPPNGGRLLVADFVDPQEVKARLDAPPNIDPTPSRAQPQAAPHLPVQRQQPPVSSLPPPPPTPTPTPFNLLPDREHLHLSKDVAPPAREWVNFPPPPPPSEKVDPPVAALDDFFRKTKSTPRIYYSPLSDEQVAAKLETARGKNVNQ